MYLQRHAAPFTDTPNSVLRRLLGLDPLEGSDQQDKGSGIEDGLRSLRGDDAPLAQPVKRGQMNSRRQVRKETARKAKRSPRASSGSALPEGEYVLPILESLAEHGGTAPAREIIKAVGERLKDKLSPTDLETLSSGVVRWENRVQFVRFRLVEEGLLSKDAPRGVWTLTTAGRESLAESQQEKAASDRHQASVPRP